MDSPQRPNKILDMEIILVLAGSHKLTSKTRKALAVMINQHNNKRINEFVKPASAVAIGRASIPPPMAVPTMSKIPPSSLVSNLLDI